jgi:type I restriction enzyme S subunit
MTQTDKTLPTAWKETTLGEVAENIFSGGTPNTQKSEYWNGNLNWLSSGETGQRFIYDTERKITKLGACESSTRLANAGNIVIATAGQGNTRGQVSFLRIDSYINQSVIAINASATVADNKWLFYNLSNRYYELRFISEANSIRGSLTTKIIESLKIPFPPLAEQKAIAAILSSFDDKIELLRRQNKTLEQITQTIFKEWFVKFKVKGEKSKIDSKIGLPNGWKIERLGKLIDVRDGTHDSPKPANNGYHLITSRHLNQTGLDFNNAYLISESDYEAINKRSKVDRYDILISMIGTVGLLYFVLDEEINFAIKNIGLFKTSQREEISEYIYLFLNSVEGKQYIQTSMAGTTQSYVTLDVLRKIPIIVPSKEILIAIKRVASPIFQKYYNNNSQIQTLSKLRDAILPKLMKGEIRVK